MNILSTTFSTDLKRFHLYLKYTAFRGWSQLLRLPQLNNIQQVLGKTILGRLKVQRVNAQINVNLLQTTQGIKVISHETQDKFFRSLFFTILILNSELT